MLSKLKKKFKFRLPGRKRKPDRTGADTGEERVGPTGSLPGPGPHVATGGHSDVDVAMGSGPRREGNEVDGEQAEQAHPSPSTPSLVRGGEPDGAWSRLFRLLPLIVSSDNINTSTIPDHGPEVLRPDERAEPDAVIVEKMPNWKSTASATAKLLLRGVRDSSEAFGPLKSVASGLYFILENCEV